MLLLYTSRINYRELSSFHWLFYQYGLVFHYGQLTLDYVNMSMGYSDFNHCILFLQEQFYVRCGSCMFVNQVISKVRGNTSSCMYNGLVIMPTFYNAHVRLVIAWNLHIFRAIHPAFDHSNCLFVSYSDHLPKGNINSRLLHTVVSHPPDCRCIWAGFYLDSC